MISDVRTAVRNSTFTGTRVGNTAPMSATSTIGLEVSAVDKNDFRNEKLYQATMSMARKMLSKGLVSEEEYLQIDTIFLEKYRPVIGALLSDISLTLGP